METLTGKVLLKDVIPVSTSPFYICISNNPELRGKVCNLEFVDGDALCVIKRARDMVHLGSSLVSSPLYGNFRPWRTPYRTLILSGENHGDGPKTDADSVLLIEKTIASYEATASERPEPPNESDDRSFRLLDISLMEDTLEKCGLKS